MQTRSSDSPPAPAADAPSTLAEDLPALYRTVLDRIAVLERLGQRHEAALIRVAATDSYSTAWDLAGRNRMLGLIARADRTIEGTSRPRAWILRRRSVGAR